MEVELTKVSEKGQIVIPANVRRDMGIKKSDQFMVFGEDDTVILKRVAKPAMKQSLAELTKPLQKVISTEGFTQKELQKIIKETRKNA